MSAQNDISFKVICKKQVVVGEQFPVSFEVNADGSDFEAPNFNNFELVGGPVSSTSSSIQWVNGSQSATFTRTYSYYLRAIKEGTFTIPAATIVINNKKYKSDTAEVEVVKNEYLVEEPANTTTSSNTADVFVEATASKKTAYVGEQIILTYKIYSTVSLTSLKFSKVPSFSGFWTKDVTKTNNGYLQESSILRNGKEYIVATIQETVLVPQKPGTITIEPLEISCIAQIVNERPRKQTYNSPFESFYGNFNQVTEVKKELKSRPVEIEVKALPTKDKPDSFTGAVGQYTFNSKINKTETKTDDVLTIIYTVSGKGNIELLDMPRPVFPPSFEVYEPKIATNTKSNSQGINGTKTAEYTVIPRKSGDFVLNPTEFSYFDPAKAKYVTLYSDSYNIKVEKGENEGKTGIIYAGGQEDIKKLGSDIYHIMKDGKLRKKGDLLFASPLYFILIIVMTVIMLVALFLHTKIYKRNQNQVLVRNRKATKIAKKRLQNAFNYLKVKDQNHFYEELSQALWGYISDKLNIPRSKLSMDTVKDMMSEKNVPEEIIVQFIDLLNSCEFARFAPGDPDKKMEELYEKGLELITKAEKNLN